MVSAGLNYYTMLSIWDNYFATPKEAEAMVAKAVKALGADRTTTLKEITGKDKKWVDRDLYPVVYDMHGKCIAHGQNEKQVGKDLIDLADADGKEFIKERVSLATSKGKFWQDYKFTDPVSKKVLPKSAYCEKTGENIATPANRHSGISRRVEGSLTTCRDDEILRTLQEDVYLEIEGEILTVTELLLHELLRITLEKWLIGEALELIEMRSNDELLIERKGVNSPE